jgi:hypothetical protein
MRLEKSSILKRFGIGGVLALALLAGGIPASAQGYNSYSQARPELPVDQTIHHLEGFAHRTSAFDSGHERSRYDNAIRHLSEFQNGLARGFFDKGKLDQAIGDVQSVVDHNPLDEHARRTLWNDLNNLRAFRATRGSMR